MASLSCSSTQHSTEQSTEHTYPNLRFWTVVIELSSSPSSAQLSCGSGDAEEDLDNTLAQHQQIKQSFGETLFDRYMTCLLSSEDNFVKEAPCLLHTEQCEERTLKKGHLKGYPKTPPQRTQKECWSASEGLGLGVIHDSWFSDSDSTTTISLAALHWFAFSLCPWVPEWVIMSHQIAILHCCIQNFPWVVGSTGKQ